MEGVGLGLGQGGRGVQGKKSEGLGVTCVLSESYGKQKRPGMWGGGGFRIY